MSSVIYELKSVSWWKAAGIRAARTALAVLIPFVLASNLLDLDWILIGSTTGFAIIASFVTSLAGLKEVTGDVVPKYWAILVRTVKTFAQTLLGYLGAATILQEVEWKSALLLSAAAAITSLLQGLLSELPEENKFAVG
jgi:hypothetical protein